MHWVFLFFCIVGFAGIVLGVVSGSFWLAIIGTVCLAVNGDNFVKVVKG